MNRRAKLLSQLYTIYLHLYFFFFDQQRNRRDQLELVLCLLRVSLEVHCVVFPVVSRLCEVQRVLLSGLT